MPIRKFALTLFVMALRLAADPSSLRAADAGGMAALERYVHAEIRCRGDRLFDADRGACTASLPPACARAAGNGLVDLLYGAAPSTRVAPVSPEARCQRAIGRAAASYLRTRMPRYVAGDRRAPLQKFLRRIAIRCHDAVVRHIGDGRVPAIGEACAPLLAGPDLDEQRLARCLSARMEALLDTACAPPLRPNVVVVLTDDQRWDTLGYMPHVLADLAERGVQFTNGFATTPACAPSRASILSGRLARHHGIRDNDGLLTGTHDFDHENTLAAWMRAAGYRTALFGKYLNHANVLGETKPAAWDEWQSFPYEGANYLDYTLNVNGTWTTFGAGPEDYSTDYLARAAIEFMRVEAAAPFFVVYAPYAPHEPVIPAARHEGAFAALDSWRPPNFREPGVRLKPAWVRFMRGLDLPVPELVDIFRQRQLESLQAVDEAVHAVSRTLDDLGVTDRTLVLYLSDHGLHWGEHWWVSKFSSYEESIRIPLVLRYPLRYPLPRQSDAQALTIDVAPTIAALAGAAHPVVDGMDLLPILDGAAAGRDDVVIENFTNFIITPNAAIRTPEWKYIATPAGGTVTRELYDLREDPYELENLAFDPAYVAVRASLEAELTARTAE